MENYEHGGVSISMYEEINLLCPLSSTIFFRSRYALDALPDERNLVAGQLYILSKFI